MASQSGSLSEPPGGGPGTGGPDPVLLTAAAMVFVDDPTAPVLTPGDAHHLLDVLRLRPAEVVIASDGAGSWVPCRVAARPDGKGAKGADLAAVLAVDGPKATQPKPQPAITLAFAPTKGDRPEWVTQKLTELGVDRIVPLRANRSVVRWEGERGARAADKLQRVAREASAQCRRMWLPDVTEVMSLKGMVARFGIAPCLAQPGGDRPGLSHPMVAVGPEGGWDDEELTQFGGHIGLGPTVLRAETAAVAAGALLCGLRNNVVGPLA